MYAVNDVSQILKNKGYDISTRSINYYVYDKKMFDIEKGKKSFTDLEIEKLMLIKDLQQYTTFNLSKIKKIISDYSIEEVREIISNKIQNAENKGYSSLLNSSYSSSSDNFQGIISKFDSGGGTYNSTSSLYTNEVFVPKSIELTKCITLIHNEVIIMTNKKSYSEEVIREIKSFIDFKLISNKYIENDDLYREVNLSKLNNNDTIQFLNIEKYKNIRTQIIDFINYKISEME